MQVGAPPLYTVIASKKDLGSPLCTVIASAIADNVLSHLFGGPPLFVCANGLDLAFFRRFSFEMAQLALNETKV